MSERNKKQVLSRNYYFKKRLYSTVFLTVIIIIATVMIISGTFAVYFRNSFRIMYMEKFALTHKNLIENIIDVEYELWQQGSFILSDNDVAFIVNEKQTDIDTRHKAIKSVRDMKAFLGIKKIDIICEDKGICWDGESLEKYGIDRLTSKNFGKYYDLYKSGMNFFIESGSDTLTYFYDDYRGYTVVFGIDYNDFVKNAEFPQTADVQVYYKNTVPLLLSGDETITVPDRLLKEQPTEGTGSFVHKNRYYIYTYMREALCISSTPVISVLSEAMANAPFIWIFTIIIVLIIVFGMKFIKGVLAKVDILRVKINRSNTEMSITKLFMERETDDAEDKAIGRLFETDKEVSFAAFIFIIDNAVGEETRVVCDIINNVLSERGRSINVCISKNRIGVLYMSEVIDDMRVIVDIINEEVKKKCGTTVTVIKSKVTYEVGEMLGEIKEILPLASYRFIKGYGCFIDADKIENLNKEAEYPLNLQIAMITSCKSRDMTKMEELLGEFIAYIDRNDYTVAENWTLMLFMSIIRSMDFADGMGFEVIGSIIKCDTFNQASERLLEYLAKQSHQVDETSGGFVRDIERMVEENYSNVDFDLNYMAREMNRSSVYLSHKFKVIAGKNFSKYLVEYRLNEAKKLLRETGTKVSDISEMCGFGSVAYFSSIFKKNEQITPREYREKNKDYE